MDKVAEYKKIIYDIAMEKEAGILGTVAKTVGEMGLGKKMLAGAGIGGALGLMKQPAEGQDRLSNAVSGAFSGAALGATVHGLTGGLKGAAQTAKGSGAIITPAPAPKLQIEAPKVSESMPKYNFNEGANVPPKTTEVMPGSAVGPSSAPPEFIDAKYTEASMLIDELYQEKVAIAAGEVWEEGAKVLKDGAKAAENGAKEINPNSFSNKLKRTYNNTLGANTLKTTTIGAGLGGAAGALGYKEDQDDGSFERSRFGAMAGGLAAGAGAGLAGGMIFKPIKGVPKVPKVADYKDVIYDMTIEKQAASLPQAVVKGAKDALTEFKSLEPIVQVAIGSSIGGTVGLLTGLQKEKDKDGSVKDKMKSIGVDVFRSAMIGGSVAGMVGFKPGQLKTDVKDAKEAIKILRKEGVL